MQTYFVPYGLYLSSSMSGQHHNKNIGGSIVFGLVLNSGFTLIEFVFGIVSGSLALIADATHNLTDTFTLAVSFVANQVAGRSANASKTFGYGRATILAALLNASAMLAIAGFIAFEAMQRLAHPQPINGGVVATIGAVGVVVNGTIAYVLSKQRHDLNLRTAFVDMAFDALSSIGAVVAGLVIMYTHINGIDSIIGLLVAVLLAYNTLRILSEAVQVLLEGTPKGIDIATTARAIAAVEGVLGVDDLHIWSIRTGYNALSGHIIIDKEDLMQCRKIVETVKASLKKQHNIQHATIEVELQDCTTHEGHEKH